MLRQDINSTAQVDVAIIQHLLEFCESRGINTTPAWQLLKLNPAQPLPSWVVASRLSDVYLFLQQQGIDYSQMLAAGEYIAKQDLSIMRILRYGDCLENVLPLCCRFSHFVVGRVTFDIVTGQDEVRLNLISAVSENTFHYAALLVISGLYFVCRDMLDETGAPGKLTLYVPQNIYHDIDFSIFPGMKVLCADSFSLGISSTDWQRNNPFQQAESYRYEVRQLEKGHHKFNEYLAIYGELKSVLQTYLPDRQLTQEYVAERLGISVRNLQRRLKALGTNYQNLLDETRHSLALLLLQHEEIPLYEVAYKVGYNEPSAFYKAFKRWTGMTPGDYRLANQ